MKITNKVAALAVALLTAPAVHAQGGDPAQDNPEQIETAQKLIDRHFEIWNSADYAKRKASFAQIYSPGFYIADYHGVAKGYDAVIEMIQRVQSGHAGFLFTPKPIALNHGVGRVTWGYGPRDNPDLITGEDIFTVEDGKLASARVFLNNK